jgi:hypothetical protein
MTTQYRGSDWNVELRDGVFRACHFEVPEAEVKEEIELSLYQFEVLQRTIPTMTDKDALFILGVLSMTVSQ